MLSWRCLLYRASRATCESRNPVLEIPIQRRAVRFIPKKAKNLGPNAVTNPTDRAVGKNGVELARMGRAEQSLPIADAPEVGGRCALGQPHRVLVPAGGVALIVVVLRLPEKGQVQSLLADKKCVRSAISNLGNTYRLEPPHDAGTLQVACRVVT